MLQLKEIYSTSHLTTRSLAKKVFDDLVKFEATKQVLDFKDIQFVSRSFMVQLYAMLAKNRSQARFINMNENVEQMYHLSVSAWNRPIVWSANTQHENEPHILSL